MQLLLLCTLGLTYTYIYFCMHLLHASQCLAVPTSDVWKSLSCQQTVTLRHGLSATLTLVNIVLLLLLLFLLL